MKRALLDYLACPDCGGDVLGDFEEELEEGELSCAACPRTFPVNLGVPSLLASQSDPLTVRVAGEFAEQWKRYDEQRDGYQAQMMDWLAPVTPDFFSGKVILDGGCGKGRHLRVVAKLSPRLVVGVDLGVAAYVAKQATRDLSNVEVVRGDLLRLPFKRTVFDYSYSIGVLHHLPDPRGGFESLRATVRPDGHISAWVYGYENNEWIVSWVSPFREHISNRMPRPVLRVLSWIVGWGVKFVAQGLYRPWSQRFPHIRLFYQDYLLYVANFPHREIESIVYDHLNPKIATYLRREEFQSWFDGLQDVTIGWHNRNSWRGFGRLPSDSRLDS